MKRAPESQRTYETLRDLIEGKFTSSDAHTEQIRLAGS